MQRNANKCIRNAKAKDAQDKALKKVMKSYKSMSAYLRDKQRPAKKAGWRIAKSGRKYYEARPNHSDVSKKKRI